MLPPHAMVMEAAQMMEIANVTMVSMQLIAQVNFLWIVWSLKCFFEILNYLLLFPFIQIVECDAAQNCSSKGICGPDGACDCDPSFYGDNCTSKLRKLEI